MERLPDWEKAKFIFSAVCEGWIGTAVVLAALPARTAPYIGQGALSPPGLGGNRRC